MAGVKNAMLSNKLTQVAIDRKDEFRVRGIEKLLSGGLIRIRTNEP